MHFLLWSQLCSQSQRSSLRLAALARSLARMQPIWALYFMGERANSPYRHARLHQNRSE